MSKSEKRLRFEKVASKRVQKIIDTIDLLANCANKGNYDYDDKDVEQMFAEMTKHLRDCRSAYYRASISRGNKKGFSFDQ